MPSFPFAIRSVGALAVAVLLGVLLTGVMRTHSAWKTTSPVPGLNVTSGCEEESLFAVWRQTHGETVYLDSSRPPYSAAYFNWLFYRSYGTAATLGSHPEDPVALVKNGRLFTLLGVAFGAGLLGALAWRLTSARPLSLRLGALALALFTFMGPLPGWWIVTIRPDLWATSLECTGLVLLLSAWRRPSLLIIAAVAVAFYGAWAFKQNFVQGLGVSLLFLLSHRQWKSSAALLALSVLGWGATLLILGPGYRAALFSTAASSSYDLAVGWHNLGGAFLRCLPIILPACCLPFLPPPPNESPLIRDTLRLAKLGLPLSFAFSFATSCKLGAASNYYFTPMLFTALLALVAIARARSILPVFSGLLAALALCAGLAATGSLEPQPARVASMQERWSIWETAPGPRYSDDQRLNLPWLNPGQPVYLPAFNYPNDRARGRVFAHDGIGGLIREKYFKSLLLPEDATGTYDGASLEGYHRAARAAGLTLWLLATPTGNPGHDQ